MTDDRATRSIAGAGEALEIAGITERGPVRAQNQDVWDAIVGGDGRTAALVLADGMGGHKGGLEFSGGGGRRGHRRALEACGV